MFQDVSLGSVRFKTKQTHVTASVATTTDAIETRESEAQTLGGSVDAGTQTEAQAATGGKAGAKGTAANAVEEPNEAVLECLARIGPAMLREMARSRKTAGSYGGLEAFLEESEDKEISKLLAFAFDYDAYFQPAQKASGVGKAKGEASKSSLKLSCTGVSWNSTGSVLAVSYGRFDHTGWCNYRSALCLWNVFQSDFNGQKPTLVLETSSGLMCVAYHPTNPSIVAAGSFNGEVMVWDTEPEEYKVYASGIGDFFHREPVTKVAWVYDVQAAEYNVTSVSGDGKVLFWRLRDKLAYPVEGYVMHLPQSSAATAASTAPSVKIDAMRVIGGKALGFCIQDKTSRSFVVGSEGGGLVRCFSKGTARSADFKGEKKWTATAARLVGKLPSARIPAVRRQVEAYATEKRSKEITLAMIYEAKLDPNALYPSAMDFVFDTHGGPVYDVNFSPFRKSLFLTCSSDGTARMYSYQQKEPILSLEVTPSSSYLYAIEWSKTRPTLFGIAAEDGNVYLYDLKNDRVNPSVVLRGKDPPTGMTAPSTASSTASTSSTSTTPVTTSGAAMFDLAFNPRQRNFLAAGDADGVIHVWKLSWHLANFQSGESGLLEAAEAAAVA